jgi:WS/DGAT C-terminal domain
MPLYLAGARVLELFQAGVTQGNVPLGVGVLSYAGQLNFDLVSDANTAPDEAVFAEAWPMPPPARGRTAGTARAGGQGNPVMAAVGIHPETLAVMRTEPVSELAILALVGHDRVVRPWLRGQGRHHQQGSRMRPLGRARPWSARSTAGRRPSLGRAGAGQIHHRSPVAPRPPPVAPPSRSPSLPE